MYDVIVLGAGPAGYVFAIRAAQLGMKVACVESRDRLGGTCLNVGCIPSKTLLQSSEYYDVVAQHGQDHGIISQGLTPDLSRMMKRKEDVIAQLGSGIDSLFKKNAVQRFSGVGYVLDPHTVKVEGKKNETLQGKKIVLAMGSEPIELPFLPFNEETVLSSTGALNLKKIPESMVVIGAGVIGLELASVYRRLGTKVHIVELLDYICPALDRGVSKALMMSLKKQGLNFLLGTKLKEAKISQDDVALTLENESGVSTLSASKVLVGVGRKPRSRGVGLESLGIAIDARGFISVDSGFQTNVPSIYAIGDVIEGPMLAHKASQEALALAENLAGHSTKVNYLTIPNVVYTQPEVASVGLTEEEAKKNSLEIKVGVFSFRGNSRSVCSQQTEGFVKILAEAHSLKVVGMHIVHAHASEMIGTGVTAMENKMNVKELAAMCYAHPTYNEAIKEAALAVYDKPLHG